MTDWTHALHLVEREALPALRYLEDTVSPDPRGRAHVVACLLQALDAVGIDVRIARWDSLTYAIERDYLDTVRVVVSVTRLDCTMRNGQPPHVPED